MAVRFSLILYYKNALHFNSEGTTVLFDYQSNICIFISINCINICILLVTSRSDPPEGAGDCRAEAEDSRGDGRDAEPVVLDRHHQPQHRRPALLFQVHGQ